MPKGIYKNPEYSKQYRLEHRDVSRKYDTQYRLKNKDTINKKARENNKKQRLLVLQYYSAPIPFCICCGEREIKFLAIDHMGGMGNKHRKEIGLYGGSSFCKWLIKNNFPPGFQVLCHNCNMAKGFYGDCPHKDLT